MLEGKWLVVHPHCEEAVTTVVGGLDREPNREVIHRPADYLLCLGLHPGTIQDLGQRDPEPLGVPHQVPSDRVGDTGQCDVALHHPHVEEVGIGDGVRTIDHALDTEGPRRQVNSGH